MAQPHQQRPLGAYAVLAATFAGGFGAFVASRRANGGLPERIPPSDVVLLGVATHKLSRLIAKDKIAAFVRAPFAEPRAAGSVPGEVEDRAKGDGLQGAVGQLLTCPHCLSVWIAAGFAGGMVVAPRETRLIAVTLSTATLSDFLQVGYRKTASREQPSEPGQPAEQPVSQAAG
jgi:Protein of unknown function (DUF1360)